MRKTISWLLCLIAVSLFSTIGSGSYAAKAKSPEKDVGKTYVFAKSFDNYVVAEIPAEGYSIKFESYYIAGNAKAVVQYDLVYNPRYNKHLNFTRLLA